MKEKEKTKNLVKTLGIIFLIVSIIISIILFIYSFYTIKYYPAYSNNVHINYVLLPISLIYAVLSIISFIGIIKLKNWGRMLAVIFSIIISIMIVVALILVILNPMTSHGVKLYFSNVDSSIIIPIIVFIYYFLFALYLILNKKAKEIFK